MQTKETPRRNILWLGFKELGCRGKPVFVSLESMVTRLCFPIREADWIQDTEYNTENLRPYGM